MTQEEIQQKAYEVYPLDLDRHLIIEGEPYDNNKEKREAYIRGLTDSKPELPSNLDEAEFKYAQSLDEIPANQEEEKMIYDAFKAGAEWMARQGISCECEITKDFGISFLKEPFEKSAREMEGNVVVQIRKR